MVLRLRHLLSVLYCVLLVAAPSAHSQDALRGKSIYLSTKGAPYNCADAACHGVDPTKNLNNIKNGANNPSKIHSAISGVQKMNFLASYIVSQDELDLAAYIGNPSVTAAPAIAVAPSSLTFASTYVGSASPIASVAVSNSGAANLVLSSLGLSGANAAEFRIEASSTCAGGSTLVPGASCRIDLTFRPTSTGTRSASVAIAHNATGGTTSVPLSGSASAPPAPSISLSPGAITFPSTTAGSASAVYSVTAANTGTAALIFSAMATTGANAGDFRIEATSTCSATSNLAPGASCRVDLTYRPSVIGSESASLAFTHNAGSGSSSVALNGTSTAAPAPSIALSANTLTFGPQEVGTQSGQQTITVTNVGNGALSISALTAGGTNSAEFPRSGSCQAGMTLAATGGNCTLVFAFAPAAVGTRTGNLTIGSNNSGGDVTVSLAGNATTNVPTATITPTTLSFGTQQIGTSSAAQRVTVSNAGGGTLSITSVAVSTSNFTQSGSCVGASLTAGKTCTVDVVFAPGASGSLAATLNIAHNATGSPLSVALSGTGSTAPVPVVQAAPATLAFPGVTVVGQPSATQRVTISNAGPGSVTLGAISTSSAEFVVSGGTTGSCAAAMALAQGASCTVDVRFSPSAPGARSGGLTVSSNGAPSTLSIALSGDATGVAAPGISSDRTALSFGSVAVNAQSPAQSVSLTNTGSTNLDVTAVSIAPPFALASGGTCSAGAFTLTPGQSCLLQVQFTPTSSGTQSGTLSFASNAGNLAVALSGDGMAAPTAVQNVSVAGTPSNAGGGGAIETGGLLALIVALAFAARRPSARRER